MRSLYRLWAKTVQEPHSVLYAVLSVATGHSVFSHTHSALSQFCGMVSTEASLSFHYPFRCKESRDSSVGIALGYGLDDWGSRVRFQVGAGNFSLHHRVQNGSGAHPASYPVGNRGSFPGVKRPGLEADHSPPSSAEVKE
jgi:hypothetical protein